jgi:hypothetical protein
MGEWYSVLGIDPRVPDFEAVRRHYLQTIRALPEPTDISDILSLHEALCAAQAELDPLWEERHPSARRH